MDDRSDPPPLHPPTPSFGTRRDSLTGGERYYRALFEHLPVGVYRTTPDGRLLDANPTLVAMLGFPTREALMAVNMVTLYADPADRQRWKEIVAREGIVTDFDARKRRLDGRVIWLRDSARAVVDEAGEVRYYEGAVIEVTAQHEAEERVRRSEQSFRALVESIPDGLVRVSADGTCTHASPGRPPLFDPAKIVGRDFSVHVTEEVAARLRAEIERAVTSGGRGTVEYEEAGGRRIAVDVSPASPGFALLLVRDVSETHRIRAHLLRAERLASVGVLAAGVAHEVSNPLAYIGMSVEHLRESLRSLRETVERRGPTDPAALATADEAVRDALEGVARVRSIVEELKGVSRAEDEPSVGVDVARVLRSSIKLVTNEIRHRGRLEVDVPELPPVAGRAAKLHQVFVNLLMNAFQSLPDAGGEGAEVKVRATALPEGGVAVEISDTGCGIPAEHLERVFDPFFTTKPPGIGTGLGLSICHNILSSHGGEISLESEVGRGTRARVGLRRADVHVATPAPPPPAVPSTARRAKVFIIDDEPLIGRAFKRELSRDFEVGVATSAREALEAFAADPAWDVVICDMMMPDMDGMALFEALRARHPDLAQRVVFMTGGAFTQKAQSFLASVSNPVLDKPVSLADLRRVIVGRAGASTPPKGLPR